MPELPEVETVRRGLNRKTLNQPIQGGDVLLERTIAYPTTVSEFLAGLEGTTIATWHRRGKYLLAELTRGGGDGGDEGDKEVTIKLANTSPSPSSLPSPPSLSSSSSPPAAGYLGVHLRMTGQLLWLPPTEPLQKHTRVRLFMGDDRELRFVDQRTFGQMWWVPPGQPPEQVITGLQALGPEPFSDQFSVAYLIKQLCDRRRPIKNALLDQSLVAGVGNIYADEALFLSGIHPTTLCCDLPRSQIERLRDNIIRVLEASIEAGGTTISTFRDLAGVNGNYGGVAWVYGRDGDDCRQCGTVIQRLKLAGRSAHFCPTCQL
ncbi:DNA-formamidopyrimidine glycosylase [Pantanalinema sp. GBBB05]|uniref:DNA-formamidopyrimidine glycosylase n=1 Tax=Pantanalinema sp. GBBB05 TaxID=2604139 RepID=UPI001E1648AC|nr:DNA-formamidopyrimidine glycosylase [Pantanalinema sp. GBBB05]